ncbi:cytochrome P460 family protein [Ruegeria lacuscaerulensis]|uniref:cytochrome P460 family protein n=1 Tax=Ruegeria lacuscaerulensis TaxID=55218 RepID=UPI00147F1A3A|nr:cytochrome P460 family protein [Ruegeria lacuscaerulensis]
MNSLTQALLGAAVFSASMGIAVHAGDLQAGGETAGQCAACHGNAGISTADNFPNLAGQKEGYIRAQLKAFKSGTRKNDLMNAIAANLTESDIENLANYFASLPGGEAGAVANNETGLDGSLLKLPEDYETTFTRYHRKDYDDRKQVRFFSGNNIALAGVADGGPFEPGAYFLVEVFDAKKDADGNLLKDAEGRLIAGERKLYTAMEKRTGWGDGVPDIYRNDNWRYSVFEADGSNKNGVNEAPCMACHKPLTEDDYAFTVDWVEGFQSSKTIGYSHKLLE